MKTNIPEYVTQGIRARHCKSYETLHPYLRLLYNHTSSLLHGRFQCFPYLLYGHRGAKQQNALFDSGSSKARFGESYHNFYPSLAFDLVPLWESSPFHIEWGSSRTFEYLEAFAEFSKDFLEWGGNWKNFKDIYHFQPIVLSSRPDPDANLSNYTLYSDPL